MYRQFQKTGEMGYRTKMKADQIMQMITTTSLRQNLAFQLPQGIISHKATENKENRLSERQVAVITDKTVKKDVKRQDKPSIYNNKFVNEQFRPGVINCEKT